MGLGVGHRLKVATALHCVESQLWKTSSYFKKLFREENCYKYVDENGSEQTLSSSLYSLDKESEPARLNPVYGESWKTTQTQNNAVTIEFTAGYADADSVPGAIKAAILLLVGFLYENRGDEGHRTIPKSIYHLVDPYKSFDFYE